MQQVGSQSAYSAGVCAFGEHTARTLHSVDHVCHYPTLAPHHGAAHPIALWRESMALRTARQICSALSSISKPGLKAACPLPCLGHVGGERPGQLLEVDPTTAQL